MCVASIENMVVGLGLAGTHQSAIHPREGASAKVTATYNQREDSQPANFSFFNVSPKWTLNWLSYIQDDPAFPGSSVMRYLCAAAVLTTISATAARQGHFLPETDDVSVLVLVSKNPVTYQRTLKDGSIETYAQSDGSAAYPRRVFLTQIIDRLRQCRHSQLRQ